MLDRLQVAVRLRGAFEAAELGWRLLRRHAWPAWKVTLAFVLPLALGLGWWLRAKPWLMPLLVWWLKPLWDRPILHVLARATFGEVPSLRDTLKSTPSLFRRGTVAGLFWRRFSDVRSMMLPLLLLEGQQGEGYRRRRQVLLRRGRFKGFLHTIACFVFQLVMVFGALGVVEMLVPQGSGFSLWEAIFEKDPHLRSAALDLFLQGLPVAAMVAVEPFFVAGGFGLYLNRRVELEGWDIELAFRRLAARIVRAAATAVLLLGLALPLAAQSNEDPKGPSRAALQEVLKQPEFQTTKEETGWHWKEAKEKKQPQDTRREAPGWILALIENAAFLLKVALIAAAVALLVFLLWRYRQAFMPAGRGLRVSAPPPAMFGLDLRPEKLPRDVAAEALALWRKGETRAALALLYRGALSDLVHRFQVELPKGATEGECLRLARPVLIHESAAYFQRLTRAWQGEAYADRRAAEGEALCLQWTAHFGKLR